MVDVSWVSATVPGPRKLKKKLKESHKNHMTKQLKINKRNGDVSRPFMSAHRYEVIQNTHASRNGRARERGTPREITYLSWFLFLKSPRIGSLGNPQVVHQ